MFVAVVTLRYQHYTTLCSVDNGVHNSQNNVLAFWLSETLLINKDLQDLT